MKRCIGLTGLLFGHNYSPRYSEGPIQMTKLSADNAHFGLAAIKASKSQIYECDVCIRCGQTNKPAQGLPQAPASAGDVKGD